MKNIWVQDLTSFFENLGKTNISSSLPLKKDSNCCEISQVNKKIYYKNVDENSKYNNQMDSNASIRNSSSEHCFNVKTAKDMFEKMSSVDKSDNVKVIKQKLKKQISVYDIFSGAVIDLDIPLMDCEQDEDNVYSQTQYTRTPSQRMKFTGLSQMNITTTQLIEKKKSLIKSPSYSDRKSMLKKNANNFRSVATESDIDKENNGVIIRMKNQESYYDGRAKYKSLLPEVPVNLNVEHKRGRRSLLTQKAIDKSLDNIDGESSGQLTDMNSMMLSDISLPPIDGNHTNIEKICQEEDNDSDELEPIGECDSYSEVKLSQLISQGPQRIKWAETEEGKKLIRMKGLKSEIIKWQEAQFEVITSEASYYQSLQTLVNKIYKSPFMICQGEKRQFSFAENNVGESNGCQSPTSQPLMTALQKHHLFSNILEIHICSGELLKALETRWRENPFIEDLSDILVEFSKEKLKPYITYLRNQQYQTSTYNQLLTKPEFQNVIRNIETDLDCGMMNLSSFLLLPMQRMLRLKLLFTVVKHYIPEGYPVQGCDAALMSLESLIRECSDQKMLMEQKEEIMKIYNRLSFKQQTGVSIGNKPLLKNGPLRISANNSKASRSLNSSFMNRNNNRAQLYLFEDQLIIAKTRKLPLCLSSNDDREMVVDICPRSAVSFDPCFSKPLFSVKSPPNDFKLILAKGLKGCAEYICEADSKETLEEWQNVFSGNTNEWEEFEFNDVLVTRDYKSTCSKELDLKRGQILSITKKINSERAIATSGDKQGEIPLSHVQYVSAQQTNPELMQEIRDSISHKKGED